MKKNKFFWLASAALSLMSFSAAHADDGKTKCSKWITDYNDVHCVYITGLPEDTSQGRYIKHYDSHENISYTRCVNAKMTEDDVYQDIAEDYVGTRAIQYSICTDASGAQCEPLGTDTYTVAKDGVNYVGTPTLYAIDLTAVKDKYPACTGYKRNE